MSNLDLYDKVRKVPAEAQKRITGGRLNGMTDINPMWRVKTLTEQFGPCGVGWKYVVTRREMIPDGSGQMAVFVDVELSYRIGDQWSAPIPGTGGSMFVAKEKSGLYASDECYKMALTDALSVACKALGIGADVYWDKDASKYTRPTQARETPDVECADCGQLIEKYTDAAGKTVSAEKIVRESILKFGVPLCASCGAKRASTAKVAGYGGQ